MSRLSVPFYRNAFIVLAMLAGPVVFAVPGGVELKDNGIFSIGRAVFFLQHFSADWQGGNQTELRVDPGFPQRTKDSFRLKGAFKAGGADIALQISEQIDFQGNDALRYVSTVHAAAPAPTAAFCLSIDIPAGGSGIRLSVDGAEQKLPAAAGELTLATGPAGQILIAFPERQIEINGDFAFLLQDNRQFGVDTFSIRLSPADVPKQLSDWHLEAGIRLLPPEQKAFLAESVLTVDPDRGMLIGNAVFSWALLDQDWKMFFRRQESFTADRKNTRLSPQRTLISGVWKAGTPLRNIDIREELRRTGETSWHYSGVLEAPEPVKANCLALLLILPAGTQEKVLVDKQELLIPETFREMTLLDRPNVKSLTFQTAGYTVTVAGEFGLVVQDDRRWNDDIQYRILPAVSSGLISRASLEIDIRIEPFDSSALDLRNAANAGFRYGYGGGWFDLGALKPGTLVFPGGRFEVIDPAVNNGKSCIVLAGNRNEFPPAISVDVASGRKSEYLYLLHASVWPPQDGSALGNITVEYAGGASRTFPVISGQDCGNWEQPSPLTNGAVAWTGETPESFSGLYLSQFRIDGVPRKLTFTVMEPSAAWIIAGASFGDRKISLEKIESEVYRAAGPHWLPVEFSGDVRPGSPLDFSSATDKPAGKYGPVTVSADGRFTFRDAPEKRIRFFGPNLVYSANYLPGELADDFVGKVSRLGYNSVRFHHFEGGLVDSTSADPPSFDPEAADRLNYLFAELKKNGFYMTLDLYASRPMSEKDRIEEMKDREYTEFEMKVLIPFSPSAMENWKKFARRLLTMKNPYTGMTWAEDPALYSVNLVNENSLVLQWNRFSALIPLIEEKFAGYLRERNMDTPANRIRRDGLFVEFLNEFQARSIAEQIRFLKEDLKLTALVTDLNLGNQYSLAGLRGKLDFVDNHIYYDHPSFPEKMWKLPYRYAQTSAIREQAAIPREIMPTRIYGKPFTVTETNYCNPNRNRLEMAGLLGGYAGLQGWDGLYRFAWSHTDETMQIPGVPQGFDIVNDPQAQLTERIIHMLFVRGDVTMAKPAFGVRFNPALIGSRPGPPAEYPAGFSQLGLFGRIGTLTGDSPSAGVIPVAIADNWERKLPVNARQVLEKLNSAGTIASVTGQIELDTRNRGMRVVTPYSEVITLEGAGQGRIMKLDKADCYQTVALLSLDGQPLTKSVSMLLIHLPDQAAGKQKFSNAQNKLLYTFGELPVLLQRSKVEVELALPEGFSVEMLKLDGSSNGGVAAIYRGGKLCFTADTAGKPDGVMVYHLTR